MTFDEKPSPHRIEPFYMLKSSFNSSIFIDIVDIYEETVGAPNNVGKSFRHCDVEGLTKNALNRMGSELCLGSKFSMHGKLLIRKERISGRDVFYFSFDPSDPEDVDMKEVNEVVNQFTSNVNQYLARNNLALTK